MTWNTRRVAELADLVNGFPFDSADFSDDATIPLVRIRDILCESFETFVPEDVVPGSAYIRDGDVIIGMDGDFNVVHWSRGRAALNQRLCLLRDNGSADMRFLAYTLPAPLKVINDLTYATTVKHLSSGQVRAIRVVAPTVGRQRAIADYLDRETAQIDELIQAQQQLIDLLRERRVAVVAHGVTHGTHRGDTTGWGRGRLKWDATLVAGGTPPTSEDSYWLDGDDPEGVPFVAIADMSKRGSVVETSKSLSKAGMSSRGMPLGGPGTLLLAMYASVGEVAFLEIEGTWNQALLGISPNSTVDRRFLAYVLASKRQELLRDVRSNTQDNLNARQIGDVWFQKPPLHVQRDIVDYLDQQTAKIDALIAEAERFIELAQERRSALIAAAVTGQIDIPGAADG